MNLEKIEGMFGVVMDYFLLFECDFFILFKSIFGKIVVVLFFYLEGILIYEDNCGK